MRFAALVMSVLLVLSVIGCSDDREAAPDVLVERRVRASAAGTVQPAEHDTRPRVIFLGDSLTAGYGVNADEAFPAVIGEMLAAEGVNVQIINMGVSGDTTAGGLRRLEWSLKQQPDVLVVGLGGNDGLRGLAPEATARNLRQIIERARESGARVLLLGMMMPPNYGPEYTEQFRAIYPRLARDLEVPLVPFLLEGVGGDATLNQPDGIHPTAEGHRRVAENVLSHLREMVRESDS